MHCIQSLVTAATPEGTFWSLDPSSFKGPEVFWRKTFSVGRPSKRYQRSRISGHWNDFAGKKQKKNKRETVWEGTHLAFSQIF